MQRKFKLAHQSRLSPELGRILVMKLFIHLKLNNMKHSKIALGIMVATGTAFTACQAQRMNESDVPSAVVTAFQEKYPDAKDVEWEKESDAELEAEFELNGQEMSANFTQDGTWLETETEMKEKDLPEAVKNALKSQFADYEIEEIEKIATPEQAEAYEVELEKGETTLEVVMDASGKVLKQETTEGEDQEEEGR